MTMVRVPSAYLSRVTRNSMISLICWKELIWTINNSACRSVVTQMKIILFITTLFIVIITRQEITAQVVQDSVALESNPVKTKKGSIFSGRPGKSMLMSLVVPGAGQIYNKSYLRVPFVWGTIGTIGYFLVNNSRQYQFFRDAYVSSIDGTEIVIPKYAEKYIPLTKITPEQIKSVT